MNKFTEKWNELFHKDNTSQPEKETGEERSALEKVMYVFHQIGLWIYRLRGVIISIPVVVAALKLARVNYELLPDAVGIDLQTTGAFSHTVAKEVAVYGPLAVTALCLLMVLMSRKTAYPWLVSVMSLLIPLIILMTNVFPA